MTTLLQGIDALIYCLLMQLFSDEINDDANADDDAAAANANDDDECASMQKAFEKIRCQCQSMSEVRLQLSRC